MLLVENKWYRLNETNAGRLPNTSGVYELSGTGGIVLYIGSAEADFLQQAIRAHIKDPRNACIAKNAFFFRFELSDRASERAADLLKAYRAGRYGTLPECMQ